VNRRLLIFEDDREAHIARHGVSLEEVQDVFDGLALVYRAKGPKATDVYYRLMGQTDAGRYLSVVIAEVDRGVYALVTGRNATDAERRLIRHRRRS